MYQLFKNIIQFSWTHRSWKNIFPNWEIGQSEKHVKARLALAEVCALSVHFSFQLYCNICSGPTMLHTQPTSRECWKGQVIKCLALGHSSLVSSNHICRSKASAKCQLTASKAAIMRNQEPVENQVQKLSCLSDKCANLPAKTHWQGTSIQGTATFYEKWWLLQQQIDR